MCYTIDMSKILIIGNVLKDVYLKLDDRQNDFETDEKGIDWLDLAFNGTAHSFFRRTSVYGGAAVSMSVLSRLGVEAEILNSKAVFKEGEITWSDDPVDYRYIFSHDGKITYFVPSTRKVTDWTMPTGTPEWILVDRSTMVSPRLVDELKNFLKFSPATKLAVHAEREMTPAGERLMKMADVLFMEDEPAVHSEEKIVDKIEVDKPNTQLICHISPRKISLGGAEESWSLSRTDMMTHLTVYSTIVATVLGVLSVGGSAASAILWARLNAENATLEGSLTGAKLRELAKDELAKRENVKLIARSLFVPKKGILAADESSKKLNQRMIGCKIGTSPRRRRDYREMILTAPELENYVSGIIISDETARERTERGQNYAEYLTSRGIIPGIKVDRGLAKLPETGEMRTLGLDGLAERLRDYYEMGFRFAKWRAEFWIDEDKPTYIAVRQNAESLASFAKECQLAGMLPVVESDIMLWGRYSIETDAETTDRVLTQIVEELSRRNVDLDKCVIKTSMVTGGRQAVIEMTPAEVGMATAAILKHAIPRYTAGVLLLSGGQDSRMATKNLTAVCQNAPFPWPITFAFGRALQDAAMLTWKGKRENVKAAQAALKRHLQDNVEALRYLKN